ncbi:MAG: GNAT family N-acetyltransferase [Ilumatobacteraceae bacterium]
MPTNEPDDEAGPLLPQDDRDRWAVPVVLSDGDSVFIRPITVADQPALLALHHRQPREDLYYRYFSAKSTLSDKELQHFTEIDFHDRVALVMEDRGEFIAWSSYERWPGRDDADVAFLVDHEHHGRGIATLMLEHLAAIARSNGISRFTAEVLYENKPMLRVFARAGWPVKRHLDSGVTELEWALNDTGQFIDSVESREHRADSSAMARLLLPRSVAVIGASDTPDTPGHELWNNVVRHFPGPAFAVNPNHDTVGGQPAFASVGDIPDDVWLAVIAVPADQLVDTVEQCIAKHVRGAVIVTSVEGTGIDVPAMVERCRRYGMRIIGPASMGVASPLEGSVLQAALVDVMPHGPGKVAISMQSGSLGASLLRLAGELSLSVAWFVSLGDKSDVSGNDLLQFWEDDERIKVIAMYTETFGNPRKFARIARRISRKRPIVAVRAGAAAVGSGTEALYHETGLIEVPGVRAMLDVVRVLIDQPLPAGPRVAVLTNSRSPGVLAAGALRTAGLEVVEPPVALHFRATGAEFADATRTALADDGVDALVVIHAPALATTASPAAEIDAAASGATKPILAVMLGHDDGPIVPGSTVPTFAFPEGAAAVLGRMHAYATWLATEATMDTVDDEATVDAASGRALIAAALDAGREQLDLAETWSLLSAYGVTVAPAVVVTGDEHAVVAAAGEVGFPVALKAAKRRVGGRSAVAGIALDLAAPAALGDALAVMRSALGPDADEVTVQRMVTPGVDVQIRCVTEDDVGPVVILGIGSMPFARPGDGHASRLAPLTASAAAALIDASPVGEALASTGLSTDLLVDTIVRVSHLVVDHPQIAELDVNPVIVSSTGCTVTDAKLLVRPSDYVAKPFRQLG